MTKKVRTSSQSRGSGRSSQYHVSRGKDGTVTVRGAGVRTTGRSVRQAKIAAKGLVRYRSNVKFIAENSRKETKSASSVSGKSRQDLESKYRNVDTK